MLYIKIMRILFTSNFPEKYLNKDFVFTALKEKAAESNGVDLDFLDGRHARFTKLNTKKLKKLL
ncbi:MAG: hypothetical protein LBD17_04535 [Endomicrobium sp.]|jgi:hypothetical protein|nr:hypothetical protein [Endomicrobium sp.]